VEQGRTEITTMTHIIAVLTRICNSSLAVVMRTSHNPDLVIKGRAVAVLQGDIKGLRISDISDAGMEQLGTQGPVRIEFRGIKTQLIFDGAIIDNSLNSILTTLPKTLISLERRQNQRFKTIKSHSVFADIGLLRLAEQRNSNILHCAPNHAQLGSWLRISDVSLGGFSTTTIFGKVSEIVKKGLIDDEIYLRIPSCPPFQCRAEVRWTKKIKEQLVTEQGDFYTRKYAIGWSFLEPTDEMSLALQKFMKAVTLADAI
jgi:hypothetical protein